MSEVAMKLEPALSLVEDDEVTEVEMECPVLDDMDAEYMMNRIRQANAQYEKMESWYAYMLDKAKALRDNTVAWAEGNLRRYFETVPKKVTKTQQSYELPSGKMVMKKQDPEYERDDEKLIDWLKKNGQEAMVKVKESPDWQNLKKTLKISPDGNGMVNEDGEVIPGIKVVPRDDKFTVTIK